jgi:DnaJ-class molecular chaperone
MDAYALLGVARDASMDVIKKQYRKMSLNCHPDRPGGDTFKFQQLTQAYESLLRKPDVLPVPSTAQSTVYQVDITLSQAFTGCSVPFEVEGGERCYAELQAGIDHNEVVLVGGRRVVVHVNNETKFVRQGLDLTYTHNISLKEALCGVNFELDYFHQKMRLSTKSTIISPSYVKVMQGKGMRRGVNTGNLILKFNIAFPSTLTEEQVLTLSHAL